MTDSKPTLAEMPAPEANRSPVKVGTPQRFVAGGVGLLCVGAGAVATYTSHNQASTVGLLGVGSLLLIVGLVGRLPDSGKVGPAGWKYDPITALLKHADPAVREAVAEEVVEATVDPRLDAPSDRLLGRAQRVLEEGRTISRVRGIITTTRPDWKVDVEPVIRLDSGRIIRPDLVVSGSVDDKTWRFPVEVRSRLDSASRLVVGRFAESLDARVVVLVVDDLRGNEISEVTSTGLHILLAESDDPGRLAETLDDAAALAAL